MAGKFSSVRLVALACAECLAKHWEGWCNETAPHLNLGVPGTIFGPATCQTESLRSFPHCLRTRIPH